MLKILSEKRCIHNLEPEVEPQWPTFRCSSQVSTHQLKLYFVGFQSLKHLRKQQNTCLVEFLRHATDFEYRVHPHRHVRSRICCLIRWRLELPSSGTTDSAAPASFCSLISSRLNSSTGSANEDFFRKASSENYNECGPRVHFHCELVLPKFSHPYSP